MNCLVANGAVQLTAEEFIAVPGTYTRKVRAQCGAAGTLTIYAPGAAGAVPRTFPRIRAMEG